MGVAAATEAADMRALAAARMGAGLLAATAALELAILAAATERGAITHLRYQADATAATGRDITSRGVRLEIRFIVLIRVRKVESLLGSLLGRQITPVAITSPEINPELIRAPVRVATGNTPGWPQNALQPR